MLMTVLLLALTASPEEREAIRREGPHAVGGKPEEREAIRREGPHAVGGKPEEREAIRKEGPHAVGGKPEEREAIRKEGPHTVGGKADEELDAVAAVHGEAGPWAVAGWRMAKHAMKELGPDVTVKHESPRSVQFSCIADGAQAATKTSVGKLSLQWVEAKETRTTFTSAKGQLTLVPSAVFLKRFKDAPREKARENGKIVLGLKDEEIFTVVP